MSDYSFLAISDVHLGCNLFRIPELGEDLKDDFARAVDLAISLKVNYLFIVGDLFDVNKPSPDLIRFVSEQVKKLGVNGVIAAGIAGDHDKPINNATWIHLTKVLPIADLGDPRFVGYDYNDRSMSNIERLDKLKKSTKAKVEWIFLHGHVPELFGFVEEKKLLDFKEIDLIDDFPALKGIILGDIHRPTEGKIHDPKMEKEVLPYIGYCGSLGMVRPDEIGHKKGLLYYDGTKLSRVKFELDRKFIRMDIADSLEPINWVQKYTKFFRDNEGKKPVIIVEYDKSSKALLPQAAPLYEVAVVKTMLSKKKKHETEETETINIRSELKTSDRAEKVLRNELSDKMVFDLAFGIINADDPTAVLDEFRDKMLNNEQPT